MLVPQRRNALIGMIVLMIAINVGFYFIPIDYTILGNYAIAGVFGVTALATATIVVPVPYIPVVMHIAQQYHDLYHLVLVALAAGLGSVVGEISGYVVGAEWSTGIRKHALFTLDRFPNDPPRACLCGIICLVCAT